MSQSQPKAESSKDLVDTLGDFLRAYYDDRDSGRTQIKELAQKYPSEQRSLEIDYDDIYRFDPELADDVLEQPKQMQRYFEEALRLYDLPIDVSLVQAHARIYNLPEEYTFYPGEFSPSKHLGDYRGIRGEITKTSDVYPKIEEAAFECQLCSTLNRVPQSEGDFQEPHECKGCERQGPFKVNFDQSEFVDAQKLRIKVPPELADGTGQKIDAFVEDDIAGDVTVSDRVVVSGIIHFEQETEGSKKQPKFDPYLEGHHIEIEQTDQQDLDVSSEERKRIQELANGAEGDPLDIAGQSLSTKVFGYDLEKKALVLAMTSGGQIQYEDGDTDRSTLNVFLIGDPGTGKSKLIDRAEDVGWRTVGVTSRRATGPGLTVSAEQDDFGDGDWSLEAGAFVKANGGTVCIDELDDMDSEVRSFMLEPMSKQKINASIAGEQATFETRASVIAAGNPKHGRFDPYEPIPEQFDFRSDLLSRFDLIFTVQDVPDEEGDRQLADHVLDVRDVAKRDKDDLDDGDDTAESIVDPEIFRKWIALAKQQPVPPFESQAVKEQLRESYLEIRKLYDVSENSPVPVTLRDLEGLVRIAETAAKFELSETITMRHAEIATEMAGRSMQDVGKNEDGEYDADIVETGQSKSQKKRRKLLASTINELEGEYGNGVPRERVIEAMTEDDDRWNADRLHSDMDSMLEDGVAIEPQTDHIRYLGRA
ncbi:minichromosome maintenance protein MCM [Natrinema pallidum]|uniref:DNA helicase n=1 Tax=Natrinema pallidum TaxID=69527 RepID=A0A4P9THZ4_9EURY|nr:minichromosome maintenance protein MCM [Natrinema pallidum]QCW03552.1 minichromosome maintenance protein MCM [Natrinema pallidum]